MQGLFRREKVQRLALATEQVDQRSRLQLKRKSTLGVAGSAVIEHRVNALQALYRFAQRPGRQATAITQASGIVDQHQLQIPRHTVVLQPVIRQDQVQRLAGQ